MSDIAVLLGVNSRYVSECIKQNEGCSVSQFINQYRLEHAKRKLRSESEIKLSSIWLEAGFASEQSFYRIFKQYTGQTPNEWKNKA
ncbi:MAG: AraC family transcriptional regulator [Prevotella sp.]|nr:AraC family transcriptional regulator [Prevotella sp.]